MMQNPVEEVKNSNFMASSKYHELPESPELPGALPSGPQQRLYIGPTGG